MVFMGSSVLVAPWGNPWRGPGSKELGWKEVTYVLNGERLKSRSSLPLLLNVVKPSKAFIIVLDTVADEQELTRSVKLSDNPYRGLVEGVKDRFLGFIKGDLGVDGKLVEVIVAPGVGRFRIGGLQGKYSEFKGEMADFYSYVLLELSRRLPLEEEDFTLCLDLTHGINYMPTLTYRAVKELLGVMAVKGRGVKPEERKVRFKAYNAEPFVKEGEELQIHVVEDSLVAPNPCKEAISNNKKFLDPLNLAPQECKKLSEEKLGLIRGALNVDELNAFLGAVANGLPLALYSFHPEVEKLEEFIDRIIKVYEGYISVCSEENVFKVERHTSFTKDFNALVKAYATAKAVNLPRKSEVSLEDLHEVRKKFFSKLEVFKILISRELKEVEERVKESKPEELQGWRSLNELLQPSKLGEPGVENFDYRNFLAHSGLERNAVEVRLEKATLEEAQKQVRKLIMLRYKEGLRPEIEGAACKGLQDC